ncbi:MAG: hypothetical protein ACI4AM_03490, partial [Muribaculaceae bacterium]
WLCGADALRDGWLARTWLLGFRLATEPPHGCASRWLAVALPRLLGFRLATGHAAGGVPYSAWAA